MTTTNTTEWTPTKILEVADTRDLVEEGDRWVRVPGSGDAHLCDRCGRLHEVHATVLGDDGTEHIVGVGCAHTTGPTASLLRSAVSAAATVGKLRAQLRKAQERDAQLLAARNQVAGLAPPEIVSEADPQPLGSNDWRWYTVDGSGCAAYGHSLRWYEARSDYYRRPLTAWQEHDAERRGCVLGQWRAKRLRAAGFESWDQPAAGALATRLAKAERRLQQLLA